MPFHNVINLIVFPPSVSHYVLVNFLFIGIELSPINTWLLKFGCLSMPYKNSMWFSMAAFEVSMSWHNIHWGPLLQVSREYDCLNILDCFPLMRICCRITEMFHVQTKCPQTTLLSKSYITWITLKCNSLVCSFIVIFQYFLDD